MNKKREDRLVMCEQVVEYLAEQEEALAASEAATEQAAEVAALYEQVTGARGGTAKRTARLTVGAEAAKKQLLDFLPALLGPLGRIATRLQDNALLASATLANKQLRKLRPLAFIGVVEAVLTSAARADVVPELSKQGLKPATLKPLHEALAAFKSAQPATRKSINERVLAGAALEDLVDALMDELRQLDEDLKAFKLLDQSLYDGYLQARKLVTTGGKGGRAAVKPV